MHWAKHILRVMVPITSQGGQGQAQPAPPQAPSSSQVKGPLPDPASAVGSPGPVCSDPGACGLISRHPQRRTPCWHDHCLCEAPGTLAVSWRHALRYSPWGSEGGQRGQLSFHIVSKTLGQSHRGFGAILGKSTTAGLSIPIVTKFRKGINLSEEGHAGESHQPESTAMA